MKTTSIKTQIKNHPLSRIVLGLLVCFIAFIIAQQLASKLLDLTAITKEYRNLIKGITASIFVIFAYKFFFSKYEKREVTEFSCNKAPVYILAGILLGALLQCLTILVISFAGNYQVLSINPLSYIITPLAVAFSVAIFEEILIRGIFFRILEEKLGSLISLIISALIFGALHLANPNSTIISSLCIAIEAGFLLGLAFIYTRSLWFPIAIHFAWNFLQSGIFGAVTSGNDQSPGLLTTKITGNTIITGGEFGPEGTLQAIIFCSLASIALLILSKNKLIKPVWKRKTTKTMNFNQAAI